ncbi:MAG: presqualene diphosphate synthase HpnD [Rhodospirillales bacterium]
MSERVPEGVTADDLEHVQAVVRRSGTSFYWAMRLLPEEKRRAMFAVYAFCREVDDIADDPGEVSAKLTALGRWRDEIDRLYAGVPRHPIARALLRPVARFVLDPADFRALIDGMAMDAADRLRIADMEELALYCDRVACAVGRLSNRIFGVEGSADRLLAAALGQALQLTNILRDLDEDARRDRLSLPLDMLRAHGVAVVGAPSRVLEQPATADVCARLAEIARDRFAEAAAVLATCDRRAVRPAVIMMEVYRRTLRRLMSRGWRHPAEPVSVSSAEKLWVAVRHGLV